MTVHHVALETRPDDVEACARFYELLGFERVEPPPTLRDRATWLELDGRQVHLQHADDPVVPPKGHFALIADGYDDTVQRLREAGFDPESREEHWGSPRCFVRDPAGHVVELMAFPPGY